MTSLAAALSAARAQQRAALIGYLPVGFPDVPSSVAALSAMAEAGVDIVEVGFPSCRTPLDGPVISGACRSAVAGGVRPRDVLDAIERLAGAGVPTVCMTYGETVDRYGPRLFARDLASAGGRGLLTPDMPDDVIRLWFSSAAQHGLDNVFLAPHGIRDERLALIRAKGSGFVYVTAGQGVTGTTEVAHDQVEQLVGRVRTAVGLPTCAGIGISTGSQAERVGRYADGVIVGTAFVRCLAEAANAAAGIRGVQALARELAGAVRSASGPDLGRLPAPRTTREAPPVRRS